VITISTGRVFLDRPEQRASCPGCGKMLLMRGADGWTTSSASRSVSAHHADGTAIVTCSGCGLLSVIGADGSVRTVL
jgi:ribosomal protein S27E